MSASRVSRDARRFVVAGLVFLVIWRVAALAGAPTRTTVALGLYGFVLCVLFGKAYALVPTYFARQLTVSWAPRVQWPLTVVGVLALALAGWDVGPAWAGLLGGVAWTLGVLVFVGALAWSVRDNLVARETGTGQANADRRPLDRLATPFVLVVLLYLLAGSYGTLVRVGGLDALTSGSARTLAAAGAPTLVGPAMARPVHLLAAGAGALAVFAVGFRLFPRLLVASVPRSLAGVVLVSGAVGPALLARGLWGDLWFRVAAVAEATAVVGFAVAYALLFVRTDRDRVGVYGPLAGGVCGVLAVGVGLATAFGWVSAPALVAHRRLMLTGFLGCTVVGAAFHFYPPKVGRLPGADDRTALASLAALFGGTLVEAGGLVASDLASWDVSPAVPVGRAVVLAGAVGVAYVVLAGFHTRYWSAG